MAYVQGWKLQDPDEQPTAEHPLEEDTLYKMVVECRELGNKLVKEEKYEQAVSKYSEIIYLVRQLETNPDTGIQWTKEDRKKIRVFVALAYLNLSMCFLKTEQWTHCVNCATRALQGDEDPPNEAHANLLQPNQKAKAYYRRAMGRPSNQEEDKMRDCEAGLKEDPGNGELKRLLGEMKNEAKKAEKKAKAGIAKGFLTDNSIGSPEARVVKAENDQEAGAADAQATEGGITSIKEGLSVINLEETEATKKFDDVADELGNMMLENPEQFHAIKEKLRKMCEDNDAMPPEEWALPPTSEGNKA